MLGRAAAGQAHRQTQAFANDRALQKNVVPVVANLARNDLIRKRFDASVGRPLGMVCHTGHFAENSPADLLNTGLDASHKYSIPLVIKIKCECTTVFRPSGGAENFYYQDTGKAPACKEINCRKFNNFNGFFMYNPLSRPDMR